MRMLQAFWKSWIAVGLVGCHQTLIVSSVPTRQADATHHVEWANYFLFGFVGHKDVDVRDYCERRGVESVELSSNVATIALTVVTLGIYCPRRVRITCDAGVER